MNIFLKKNISNLLLHRPLFRVGVLFIIWMYVMPCPVLVYAGNKISRKKYYKQIVTNFLSTFDDTPIEPVEQGLGRGYKQKYKIRIPESNDRETMTTIMYHIYGKAPVVEDLFERPDRIWDAKTLRDLNITCGPEDNIEHNVINNLDTDNMPYSEGMGLLAKGVMPIHFGTSTPDPEELLKKQKIIRILEKDKKLRHALLKILGRFKRKHEKPFAAHYNRNHVLRTSRQLKRLEHNYAAGGSLAESSLWRLEFFKKWTVEISFILLCLNGVMMLISLYYQLQRGLVAIGYGHWLTYLHIPLPPPVAGGNPADAGLFKRFSSQHEIITSITSIIVTPVLLLRAYYMNKDTFMAYSEAFYHQQRWYFMVKEIHELVKKNKKLARLCKDLLENTSSLIEGDHGNEDLAYYLYLLETQDLANFSIFFSFGGKLLKTIGLFEKCCQNAILLSTIYEISTLAVYTHLAHYMACAKKYKNGLCYTKFVDPKEHPSTFIDIKGLWNVGIDPNKAVSNDVYMDGSKANLFFILGSNAGGKTTLAKILPVLAQTYGISPAKEATQSIFHTVLTYFNIEDGNLVKGTSQYTSELDRIEYGLGILAKAGLDKNILWIVDEGAKGTGEDFAEVFLGELAKYVIEEYPNSGFFFITHYKDLRSMEKEFPLIENYSAIVNHVSEDKFVYTYKIKRGTPPQEEDLIIALKILNWRTNFPPKLRDRINKTIKKKTQS